MTYLVSVLYIIAFAMFIYGLSGLTGPKTAVRGNYIAAVGMGIAVIAVLIDVRDTDNWGLIVGGLAVGVILGVPPALKTKMTAMPQLVALFNGVGGGTVALIAWAEYLESSSFTTLEDQPTVVMIVGSLFAAIIATIAALDLDRLREILRRIVEFIALGGVALALLCGLVFLLTWVLSHLRRPSDQSRRWLSVPAATPVAIRPIRRPCAAARSSRWTPPHHRDEYRR